jgi:hypothetical protein
LASATAATTLGIGALVTTVQSLASAPVSGTSSAQAEALIGATAPVFATSSEQALAVVDGAPVLASVTPILTANSNIAAAFAVNPSYFGLGELGGSYSTSGTGSETATGTVNLSVDLTQLASRQDLELGLFDGTALGSGFTNLALTVTGDGTTVLSKSFTTVAAATSYFTNNAIDLGSLASGALSSNTLSLSISLSVTTNTAGQGFDAGFLIGDPPASSTHQFVAAMAGFGGGTSSSAGTTHQTNQPTASLVLAGPGHA